MGGLASPLQVRVALATELPKITLDGLPAKNWPRAVLVDNLANECRRQQKQGVENPFVFTDIRKWVPEWGLTAAPEDPDEGSDIVSKEIKQLTEACLTLSAARMVLSWLALLPVLGPEEDRQEGIY